MKINKQKIFLIFLIMMLAIPIISFGVSATESTIITNMDLSNSYYRSIVVRSDGVMFAVAQDYVADVFTRVYMSDDDGDTWTLNFTVTSNMGFGGFMSPSLSVDKDDTIHLFTTDSLVGVRCLAHYSLENSGAWSGGENVFTTGTSSQFAFGADVVFDSDNMYVVWAYKVDDTHYYLKERSYNFVLFTWGGTTTLKSSATILRNPSISLFNDDLYVFYACDGSEYNIEYARFHSTNSSWTYNHGLVSDDLYTYERPKTILYKSKLYVFYQGNSSSNNKYQILYKTLSGSSWSGESVLHSDLLYDQMEPSVSVDLSGKLNVVWSGRSVVSSTYYQLRQRVCLSGEWGDVAFISSGSTNKRYSHLCYQDYPTFTWLVDGVCVAYCDDTNDDLEYIDSGSLLWYGGGSGSTSSQYGDLSMYESIGDTTAHSWLTLINARYLEEQFLVNMQCNITAVDLLVGGLQWHDDSDTSNYFLRLSDGSSSNTYECGNPTYFFDCGNGHILRWIFDAPFDTDGGKPTFEFIHTKGYEVSRTVAWWFLWWQAEPEYTYRYWYVGVDDTDLDNDGDIIFKIHDASALLDGVYNGDSLGYDLSYKFYYENLQFYEGHNYTDSILIDKTSLKRYEESLNIDAFSSDGSVPNQIRIFNVDTSTEVTNDSFPITFTEEDFKCSHTPEVLGNFNVSLYRGGVCKATETFTVIESTQSDFLIYTKPSTTNPNEQFRLRYRYNHSASAMGCIFLSRYPFVSSSYIERWYITENTAVGVFDEIFPLQLTTSGVYYFIMCCEVSNGTYAPVTGGQSLTKHTVRSQVANSLKVAHTNIVLGQEQIITGYHNHVGSNVVLRFNGVNEHAVGTSSDILVSYYPEKIGWYEVELVLISANGSEVLHTVRFSVSEPPEQADEFNYIYRLIFDLFGLMGVWIAGGVVVVAFMIMPLYLTKKYDLPEIPRFAYFGFAVVGMILAVVFQFWEVWTILAMIIAVTGGCILEYYKKHY